MGKCSRCFWCHKKLGCLYVYWGMWIHRPVNYCFEEQEKMITLVRCFLDKYFPLFLWVHKRIFDGWLKKIEEVQLNEDFLFGKDEYF